MHNLTFPFPLYLVISERDCIHLPLLEVLEQALKGGVDIVQLREKNCSYSNYLHKAIQVKEVCDRYGIPLIINDNVEVAIAVEAWGVHVGTSDMSPSEIAKLHKAPKHIGWSIEAMEQLQSKELEFVHHLGVSPIFSTPTKTNTIIEWGLEGLALLKAKTKIPLIAIGGMNETTIQSTVKAGADSIAVVSAICGSKDPYQSTIKLKTLINESK